MGAVCRGRTGAVGRGRGLFGRVPGSALTAALSGVDGSGWCQNEVGTAEASVWRPEAGRAGTGIRWAGIVLSFRRETDAPGLGGVPAPSGPFLQATVQTR